jgi:CHAT domain-containing protein
MAARPISQEARGLRWSRQRWWSLRAAWGGIPAALRRSLCRFPLLWLLLPLCLLPLTDTLPGRARIAYEHASALEKHGRLLQSQQEAELGYRQFQRADRIWAGRFLMLQAEDAVRRGFSPEAQRLASVYLSDPTEPAEVVRAHLVLVLVFAGRFDFSPGRKELEEAERLCRNVDYSTCGMAILVHGILALDETNFDEARRFSRQAAAYARARHDSSLEVGATVNLAAIEYYANHLDLAQELSRKALRDALALGDEERAMLAEGSLGLASFPFGDTEAARDLFLEAAQTAERLGDLHNEFRWLQRASEVDSMLFHFDDAVAAQRRAIQVAEQTGENAARWQAYTGMASALIGGGNAEEADHYLTRADALLPPGESFSRFQHRYLLGYVAAARHRYGEAEADFRSVIDGVTPLETFRFDAAAQLASALRQEGRAREAGQIYTRWLAIFEEEREQNNDLASHMTYLTWGVPLYTGYIQLLLQQGRSEEALALAEQSRARALTQGLGGKLEKYASLSRRLNPRQIARNSGATLLYYWLGEDESYLWAITAKDIHAYTLPGEKALAEPLRRYRQALTGTEDPLAAGNAEGRALYAMLVAPAAALLRPQAHVILFLDGRLSTLSFDALLAPGDKPGASAATGAHYWIDDVTLRTAPSLSVLEAAQPSQAASGRLLLIGDAAAASPDYPELAMAPMEMALIEKHFSPAAMTVFSRASATPAAYLHSAPEEYSLIHFVTHGVASRLDPMDSTIILSRADADEQSYKLYAHEILKHPIDARLVTISACYGSGARAYAGEGLVGLSWAFLRAGAHNVIGALWEVSEESSPRLMDKLYQGLQEGMTPEAALRQAKLSLLHGSNGHFSAPFYWASYQDYSGR